MNEPLTGLIAATYTPMDEGGRPNPAPIGPMVDRLLDEGVAGLYVCGSTGEGMSLTGTERRVVTESFVAAAAGRVPVIAQVGHNSLREAAELAAHAAGIGADVISATAPSYFKINTVEILVDCMAEIAAAAPALPFYYYHIPVLTGASLDMVDLFAPSGRANPQPGRPEVYLSHRARIPGVPGVGGPPVRRSLGMRRDAALGIDGRRPGGRRKHLQHRSSTLPADHPRLPGG